MRRHSGEYRGERTRWYAVALVTVAIAISYFDRQTLPVAISAIQRNIPISNQQFSYLQTSFLLAYAALYAIGGRLLDRLGTRRGFMLIMLWWSVACALHGFASGFMLLLIARFLLGMGGRCLSRRYPRRRRMGSRGRTLHRRRLHQCWNSRRFRARAAAHRLRTAA